MPQGSNGQRATDDAFGFLPGTLEPWAERLEALRPWADQKAVTALLQKWSGDYNEGPTLVAEHLAWIGQDPDVPAMMAAAIAFHLLRNVVAKRGVLDYGLPVLIEGEDEGTPPDIPERTWRRYRREYPWSKVMAEFQRDLHIAAEAQKAPTVKAARQRVRRRRQS